MARAAAFRGLLALVSAAVILTVGTVPAPPATAESRARVFVVFHQTPGPEERRAVEQAGGEVHFVYRIVPALSASVSEAARDRLLRDPRVVRIEPVGQVHALDHSTVSGAEYPWGVAHIGAKKAHDAGITGAGIAVAVIDSGVDYTHADLAGRFGALKGYDFVNSDGDPMDDNGHGTHVAGSVAASANGTDVVGVAPQVRLYVLKVLNSGGSGTWDSIVAALQWAVDNGIKITNNSYGSRTDPGETVRQAFANAYAQGVLHVAAAGNEGTCSGKGNNVGYPARYDAVVAVAATDSSDQRPCFSSTGDQVELAAPGVRIVSDRLGGGTETLSGTSMASPHAAGVAALVLACGCLSDENAELHHVRGTARHQQDGRLQHRLAGQPASDHHGECAAGL